MLESLYIRNLVLVPQLHLEFGAGLLAVTGETGAGKSLVLGALRLLSGGRAAASLIRRGAESCEVSGFFHFGPEHPALAAWLDQRLEALSLPPREEGRLLLRRVITPSGSRAFVNGAPVTAALLKEFGEALIDIHGPNESHSLLAPARQLHLLDIFCTDTSLLEEVRREWSAWVSLKKELQALREDALPPEEQELLSHQLQEIQEAALSPGEEEALLARHRVASNGARLQALAGMLSQGLSQGENSLVDLLAPWIRHAEELARLDSERGEGFLQRLDTLSQELNDLGVELGDYGASLELDQEALQEMEQRIDCIQKLKRRYGPTLQDVLDRARRLQERLRRASTRGEELARLTDALQDAERRHGEACQRLHLRRLQGAEELSQAITRQLQHLGFQKALFQASLSPATPGPEGADSLEFLFAPNQGEPMAPLRQAASSGEVARVMLAIKTVLSQVDDLPVLLFDEIDANIGGRTAATVAQELHALGKEHQVFSITHLPVIAAAADRQYLVEKCLEEERTITRVRLLSSQERVEELTRMLGAEPEDAAAKAHAQELLRSFSPR
ncbi:MAG: DNA repair protein RecN [Oligosphaeraceae bacterium]